MSDQPKVTAPEGLCTKCSATQYCADHEPAEPKVTAESSRPEFVDAAWETHCERVCDDYRPMPAMCASTACEECGYAPDRHCLRKALTILRGAVSSGVSAGRLSELEKENAILKLSIPLEEDLASRIDETLKHLATEQGYTLNGLARLFVDCQRRMASDWMEVGSLRRNVKALTASLQQLRSYMQHKPGCLKGKPHKVVFGVWPCDCGLDDILKTLEGK